MLIVRFSMIDQASTMLVVGVCVFVVRACVRACVLACVRACVWERERERERERGESGSEKKEILFFMFCVFKPGSKFWVSLFVRCGFLLNSINDCSPDWLLPFLFIHTNTLEVKVLRWFLSFAVLGNLVLSQLLFQLILLLKVSRLQFVFHYNRLI